MAQGTPWAVAHAQAFCIGSIHAVHNPNFTHILPLMSLCICKDLLYKGFPCMRDSLYKGLLFTRDFPFKGISLNALLRLRAARLHGRTRRRRPSSWTLQRCIYIYIYIRVCVCIYIYIYVCAYVCMYVYTYIYIYIYICMYACIYVCIYIYI